MKHKLSLLLSFLTLTSSIQAAVITQPIMRDVRLKPGFSFTIGPVWLKPGASNLNYVIYNNELPAQSPTWTEREISPGFNTGFELALNYVFPNCANQDVNLSWIHLNTSDSDNTTAPNASFFLGPDYEIGPAGIPIRNAHGNAKFNYDVVNLDVGQYLKFSPQLLMRFFAGLSNGYLKEEVKATYTGTTPAPLAGPFSMLQDSTSRFTGIGPRFGIAGDYDTQTGFGFIGEAAASALIGKQNAKTTFTGSAQALLVLFGQTVNNQFIKDQPVYQVIPGLDSRLGVYYHYMFRDALLSITAGYQAAVYFNAISQYQPQTLVAPLETGGIFVATMAHRLSNYSVQGPFLDFTIKL